MAVCTEIASLQSGHSRKKGFRSSLETLTRGSMRSGDSQRDSWKDFSKGSSGFSETEKDRGKAVRTCCRATVEFVFTQVGVGGLVVCYTIVGAFAFQAIETQEEEKSIHVVSEKREMAVRELWNITSTYNTLNQRQWTRMTQAVLRSYQDEMTHLIKEGYDQQTVHERWTFPAALMYTLSVITMIGYGNIVPRSDWGKIATMIYALVGIPVYILYFMNMGKVFARVFKCLYRRLYQWLVRGQQSQAVYLRMDQSVGEMVVPSTACVWVMAAYLAIGTLMFAEWEGWNYLDSLYFVVTSLLKIGIGDFVPGQTASVDDSGEESHAKLYINFFYILFGMGVVAMCYYLLKEEVLLRLQQGENKIKKACCGGAS